jgi:hypothetical protein
LGIGKLQEFTGTWINPKQTKLLNEFVKRPRKRLYSFDLQKEKYQERNISEEIIM